MDTPDLLKDEGVMAEVRKEFPYPDAYAFVHGDGHQCSYSTVYCKGDWDIIRCRLCGYERQIRCTFDDEYS